MIKKLHTHKTLLRGISAFLALDLLFSTVAPTTAFGLTAGPASPEFSSFEPVVTTDLVNDFTGDFTYNLPVLSIPGPDGGGYAMSLSYHAGASPEEEASWVGFGWTLNPGAINRGKRGFADDFKGNEVIKYNKYKPNWTITSTPSFNLELSSKDNPKSKKKKPKKKLTELLTGKFKSKGWKDMPGKSSVAQLSFSRTVRYNNYSGYSIAKSFGVSAFGAASLNLNRSQGNTTLSFTINPLWLISKALNMRQKKLNKKMNESWASDLNTMTDQELASNHRARASMRQKLRKLERVGNGVSAAGQYNKYHVRSFNHSPSVPFSVQKFNENKTESRNFSTSVELNPAGPVGMQFGLSSNVNYQAGVAQDDYYAYGYMYNPDFESYRRDKDDPSKDNLSDYQIEKGTTFNKHDRNLGIPHNSADQFMATGNGPNGGFRLHHHKIGHYYPNTLTNEQKIKNKGVEFGFPSGVGTIQIGFDLSIASKQRTTVDTWKKNKDAISEEHEFDMWNGYGSESASGDFDRSAQELNAPFFRFAGDQGGEISYSTEDDQALRTVYLQNKKKANIAALGTSNQLDKEKFGTSSEIFYSTYNSAGNVPAKRRLEKSTHIDMFRKSDPNYSDLIAEFAVRDNTGSNSVYGLPVFSKNEMQLSVGLDKEEDHKLVAHSKVLEYAHPEEGEGAVTGQLIRKPYASTYLLTQTTGPNYVDIGNDGPDEKDFGGWTKFGYRQAQAMQGGNTWYRHRAPYTGLFYNRGRIFDRKDQTGSVSAGEKEVYYLNYIETKSHVAFFVTNKTTAEEVKAEMSRIQPDLSPEQLDAYAQQYAGSGESRLDGIDAAAIQGGKDPAANNEDAKGAFEVEKLERILLFTKQDFVQPIKTTYFEYDYTLCQGIPNTLEGENYAQTGKLTLKKVWSESRGIKRHRIAPYQFHYNYYKNYSDKLKEKYTWLSDLAGLGDYAQNPAYEQGGLDAWGNYQLEGVWRNKVMKPWLNQAKETSTFDPAAWQLKRIVLPSGGEIHVQYEQKQYTHVQDKKAQAFVSIASDVESTDSYNPQETKYYIKHEDIGIESEEDCRAYAALLNAHFASGEKIYFKFLYAFKSSYADFNGQDAKNTTYISGYTDVREVKYDESTDRIYLSLGKEYKEGNRVIKGRKAKKDRTIPRKICYDNLTGNAGHNLHMTALYSNEHEAITKYDKEMMEYAYGNGDRPKSFNVALDLTGKAIVGSVRNPLKENVCLDFAERYSYLRLPVLNAKKGGGIRVKRLLMYDKGIHGEEGDEQLFGTEYLYERENGEESGVATNEPTSIREENALVNVLGRKDQKLWDKLLNGRDTKEFEGPLGEDLLPGASVGHDRVVMRNIHQGKTGRGYTVHTYHTCRTVPTMQVEHTELTKDDNTLHKSRLNLPLLLFNYTKGKYWATQGYRFELNDMHGKPVSMESFPGSYGIPGNQPVSSTAYTYSSVEDGVTSLDFDLTTKKFRKHEKQKPGQEEDMAMFMSSVRDFTQDINVELDLNIQLAVPPPIFVTLMPSVSISDQELSQHVTSKVIRTKSYVTKTVSSMDGVKKITEVLAFNKHNGDPILSRVYDGYHEEDVYQEDAREEDAHAQYSMDIPGSWMYKELQSSKYYDEASGDIVYKPENCNQLSRSVGSLSTMGADGNPLDKFENGEWDPYASSPSGVLSATAVELRKNWYSNPSDLVGQTDEDMKAILQTQWLSGLTEDEVAALDKHWMAKSTYYYTTDVQQANKDAKTYTGGIYKQFDFFDWTDVAGNKARNWKNTNCVELYSPHGIPLQERDVLGIPSAVKFAYNEMLPVMVAGNAQYTSIGFEDFENAEMPEQQDQAHSGTRALNLSAAPETAVLTGLVLDEQLMHEGAQLHLWLKSDLTDDPNHPDYGFSNEKPQLRAEMKGHTYDFNAVARTGAWTLYKAVVYDWYDMQEGDELDVRLVYNFEPSELVHVDDVRFAPLDAAVSCSVYDHDDFSVLAQFDDQHFATFFEYNNEGKLVRKSIETERGKRTLQEQQYNVSRITR